MIGHSKPARRAARPGIELEDVSGRDIWKDEITAAPVRGKSAEQPDHASKKKPSKNL
jgi:hypothetical protein